MRHLDLFSGIGGFALAASWVWPEHEVAAFCEIDEFCRRVLAKHWPDAPVVEDIRDLDGADYADVNLLTGGFPCTPFSSAGRRGGTEDDRYLWPEMLRVIREARPRFILAENVPGLLSIGGGVVFERVLSDLEDAGYEVQPLVIPAAGAGAPHRRDRVWIVAHAERAERRTHDLARRGGRQSCLPQREESAGRIGGGGKRPEDVGNAAGEGSYAGTLTGICGSEESRGARHEKPQQRGKDVADASHKLLDGRGCAGANGRSESSDRRDVGDADLSPTHPHTTEGGSRSATGEPSGRRPQSRMGLRDDGFPAGMARRWLDGSWEHGIDRVTTGADDRTNKLRALGNAVVPPLVAEIFRAIKAADTCTYKPL